LAGGGVTFVLFKLVIMLVSLQQELEGLVISQHGGRCRNSLSKCRIPAAPLSRIM